MQEESFTPGGTKSDRTYEQLAVEAQLGPHVTVYQPRTFLIVLLSIIVIIVGVGLIAIDLALSEPVTSYQQSACFSTIGGVLTIGGIVWIIIGLKNRKARVFVYANGLVSLNQQQKQVLRWDQVQYVWRKWKEKEAASSPSDQSATTVEKPRVSNKCVVECRDGSLIEFADYIPGLTKVTKTIEQESMRYLWPQYMNSYVASNSISFGLLTINQTGISNGDKTLLWNEMQEIRVEESGMISFYREGTWHEWYRAALEETPNVAVFEAMAKALLKR